MSNKVLFIDRKRNTSILEFNDQQEFSNILEGNIDTTCIKPIKRSICIAAGNGKDLCHPFMGLKEILNNEPFIVFIVENDEGKGIAGANILNINDSEIEYFNKFKEKVLNW